jgi:hypothetical protein
VSCGWGEAVQSIRLCWVQDLETGDDTGALVLKTCQPEVARLSEVKVLWTCA